MRRVLVACAVLAALAAAPRPAAARAARHHHHRAPRAGTELSLADLGWPAATRSALTRVAAKVWPTARAHGHRLGKIAKGQRLAWTRIVASRDRCRAWLAIEPRGWVCARDVRPSAAAPAVHDVPGEVRPGADFAGLDLRVTPPPAWPFAWALEPQPWRRRDQGRKRRPPQPTVVRAAPAADADVVRTLPPRALVPVLETSGAFARIGVDEWVALRDLRVARQRPRPDGVAAGARWIDVDLDQQVLIAYEGDAPVFATLVSSGRRDGTPPGLYRIARKVASKTMRNPPHVGGRWHRRGVPFVMYFRESYALHGAYWHDRFGNQDSVGCVNLSPDDARLLFGWADPAIPAGWLEIEAPDDDGTVVAIHRGDRAPRWLDWDGEPVASR